MRIMAEDLENKTKKNFLQKGAKWLGTAALAGYIALVGAACSTPNGPDPPPPPTKYKHSIKVEVGKTLHYGVPVTGGGFRVIMENTGVTYPPLSQDPATLELLETVQTEGTTLNLAETTNQTEPCTIILYPKVYFDNDCLPREYRNIGVTNNTLTAENVILLADVDWTYLHTEVFTKKDSMGRSFNNGREPRFLNASSNPDPLTGLRLDPIFFEGYWENGKEYGIKVALLDYQEWGKRYVGTAFEEAYITNVINFVDANNIHNSTPPPDGDFWAFRESQLSGVTNVTYPISGVKVLSSKEFVNQSSANPVSAYAETFDALFNGNQNIGNPDRFRTCVPVSAWRPKGGEESTYVYWIEGTIKESQKGVDNLSSKLQSFAQEYEFLPAAESYYGNTTIGNKVQIDYAPGVAHWTTGQPLREAVENADAKGRIKRDSVRR
ncbi:hypothetical protein JXB28_05815 [Candidatus Woesearchaeota archaeon]|nr:hypothetical protein [Candidatus Woesearchaeota archaeon]